MPTARGWWLFVPALAVVALGVRFQLNGLVLLGLGVVLWLGYEGWRFNWSVYKLTERLRLRRTLTDARGLVRTLLSGGVYTVEVRLTLDDGADLPVLVVADLVPFTVVKTEGTVSRATRLDTEGEVVLTYTIRCPHAGVARFEGVQLQLADPQGFYYAALFLRQVVEVPVLPLRADAESRAAQKVPSNRLPPPGQHRLRKPGASSELLDLRDYQPGDPPRTIAWKVSARRDKLITREFESEVPLKCTLFVDTSASVRLLSASPDKGGEALTARPLHRVVDVAAGVVQAGLANRDLVGLCLFDEKTVRYLRPDRAGRHRNEMLQALAGTLDALPDYARADPDDLLPLAYGFAKRVYPDLLDAGVNGVPFWVEWVASFPGVWRRPVGLRRYLHRRKADILFWLMVAMSFLGFLGVALFAPTTSDLDLTLSGLYAGGASAGTVLLGWLLMSLPTSRERRLSRWRKQMAALLAHRYDLGPGALEAILQDEDLLTLLLQRFLNEHQVPYRVPLYDGQGRYLHAAPEKVRVLTVALQESIRRGQDSELFVLLADLVELEDHLKPLLKALRLARSRHHQVLVIVPWPPGLPPPGSRLPPEPDPAETKADAYVEAWVRRATADRFHRAYQNLKRSLARLGVEMTCAEEGEPVALVLSRLDRLRQARRAF